MKPDSDFGEAIEGYHQDKWKDLRSAIKKVAIKADEKHIHEARVAIKKVTALYHLIEYCHPAFDSKQELKPLRKLFKLMGKIRDHGNMLQLSHKFKIDTKIFDNDAPEQEKACDELYKKCKKYKDKLPSVQKAGKKELRHVTIDKWKTYLSKERQDIMTEISSQVSKTSLHPMRKDIKDMVYNAKIYSTRGILTNAEIDGLDKLQGTIGTWHDTIMLREQPQVIRHTLAQKNKALAIKADEQKLYKAVISLGKKITAKK